MKAVPVKSTPPIKINNSSKYREFLQAILNRNSAITRVELAKDERLKTTVSGLTYQAKRFGLKISGAGGQIHVINPQSVDYEKGRYVAKS